MDKCPKCGLKIKEGRKFCTNCGSQLSLENSNQYMNNNKLRELNQAYDGSRILEENNLTIDDDLVDAYIGKNADKLKNGSFSFNIFLFGFVYILYRKMWAFGLIWFLVSILVESFTHILISSQIINILILFVLNICIASQFKSIYLNHVKTNIQKIKSENVGKTPEELKRICSEKGGTTFMSIIIYVVIIIIAILIAFLLILLKLNNERNSAFTLYDNGNNVESNELSKPGNVGELIVNIPDILEMKDNYYNNEMLQEFETPIFEDSFKLKIFYKDAQLYDNDAKQYLEEKIVYSEPGTSSDINKKEINNRTWYQLIIKNGMGQNYYYAIIYHNKLYVVEIYIKDSNSEKCQNAYNEVVNSIKLSK